MKVDVVVEKPSENRPVVRQKHIYICCFKFPHSVSLVARLLYFALYVIVVAIAYLLR